MAIRSFKDRRTEALFLGRSIKGAPTDLIRRVKKRLLQLDGAGEIRDLRLPSSNRLEALAADRIGQYSIRVNDQWRICFRWIEGGAEDVEFVDYH